MTPRSDDGRTWTTNTSTNGTNVMSDPTRTRRLLARTRVRGASSALRAVYDRAAGGDQQQADDPADVERPTPSWNPLRRLRVRNTASVSV